MNKFKLMLALLAAPSMVLASCGAETPEVQGSVSKVSVTCDSTVKVGKTVTAKANVSASGGASKEVTWSSSDSTVATVDANGVVTGIKAGKVTITATSKFDSTKAGSVEVEVLEVVSNWPSEEIADYIGDHTDETLPEGECEDADVFEQTTPYEALIIDFEGSDPDEYLEKLEEK